MIELYVFINPLCPSCLAVEKRILHLIEADTKRIQFKFVPLLNFQVSQTKASVHPHPHMSLAERNVYFKDCYEAALDYKAMLLQGKKKGRAFLFALQERVGRQGQPYSAALAKKIVADLNGDLPMFLAYRNSPLVEQALAVDQKTAQEMTVTQSGSLVIFNYTQESDYGLLLEGEPPQELLEELLALKPQKPSLHLAAGTGRALKTSANLVAHHPPHLELLEN